ncbi:MAG: hypothetical protein U0325_17810 [Polyangiales bacterium]
MRRLALALGVLACVEPVTVARVSGDVGSADATPAAPMAVEGVVTVTALANTADRSRMTVDVDLAAPAAGVTIAVGPEGGTPTQLERRGARVGARLVGYPVRWQVVRSDGVAGVVDFPPPFVFTAPRSDEGVSRDVDLPVAWTPFGGAVATLLSPDGPRVVPDSGALVVPRGALAAARDVPLRVMREHDVTLAGALTGALRVRLVTEQSLRAE